jgi:hypothetical protein
MAAKADLKTTISADMTGFAATMRRAGGVAKSTGTSIGNSLGSASSAIGGLVKSAGAATIKLAALGVAAAGAGLIVGIKSAADLGGKLADLSARTGIAAGKLAVMGRAFEDNGVSADKIGGVINKLQKTITDFGSGSASAAKPFDALGIKFDDISKLDPAAQFELIQSKISAIQDPAQRAALAMQIFGKSGGELLTLFADGEAFANAGAFLGTQAEILDRSAGLFDSISDKMARIPEKLQGFFVGFLEPIAGDIDEILTRFEAFDFAALGLKLGEMFAETIDNIKGMFQALDLGEMFEYAGLTLKNAFIESVNFLAKGISAVIEMFKGGEAGDMFETVGMKLRQALLLAGADLLESLEPILGERAKVAADYNRASADLIDAEMEAKAAEKEGGPSFFEQFKKNFEAAGDVMKMPEEDAKRFTELGDRIQAAADEFGKKREEDKAKRQKEADDKQRDTEQKAAAAAAAAAKAKEDSYKVPQIDGTTYGPPKPTVNPEGMGPSKTRGGRGFGEAVRPSNRAFGEAVRPSNRVFGEAGAPLGTDNVFAKDRERLGIASGMTTGGLGEKRRLNTSANDKEAKKNLSLQEQQAASLQSIESNIKSAVTVN